MFGIEEKSPLGPIVEPKPGPTLDIDVAAPEIEVTKSSPVKDSITAKRKNINEIIDEINFSSIELWLYFIINTPFG